MQTGMASHDDDSIINFSRLEKDSLKAFEADAKYWVENDAKIRAVQNKVGSYEEFKDIVLASHLKPLDKGDKVTLTFNQPWNMTAEKSRSNDPEVTKDNPDQLKQDTHRLPKNGQEFVRDWRRYYKTADERCAFLLYLGPERLAEIFKAEISFGLLGDFVEALLCFSKEETEKVCHILAAFSKVNRFSLSVQFMSKKEKANCVELFKQLQQNISESSNTDRETLTDIIMDISKVYEVSLDN